MKTYEELNKEFKGKVAWLQKKCLHEKTEWYDFYWAPGHGDGRVKMCKVCGKTLEHILLPVSTNITTSADFRLFPYKGKASVAS